MSSYSKATIATISDGPYADALCATPVPRVALKADSYLDWQGVSDDCGTLTNKIAELTKKPDVPAKTKNKVTFGDKRIVATIYENGFFKKSKDLLPDFKSVTVYHRNSDSGATPKAVEIEFADGTSEKAVCLVEDEGKWTIETGITICICKRLLDCGNKSGSSIYNKLVSRALKVYNDAQKAEATKVKAEEARKAKMQKLAEKKRTKAEKRAAAQREEKINIIKEAIIRAGKISDWYGCHEGENSGC